MGLTDLLATSEVPGTTMSLPQAMNALRKGEIAPPADIPDGLGKLMPPSSALPKLKPRPDPLADIAAQQRAQDQQDREEMLVRIRARQIASPSEHMGRAERQLRGMENV